MKNLASWLKTLGSGVEPDDLREVVIETFETHFGDQTVDGMLCEIRPAIRFCHIVRERIECKLPYGLINMTLMNTRKQSRLKRGNGRVVRPPEPVEINPDDEDSPYRQYLRSKAWRRIRMAMLWIADYRCQLCGRTNSETTLEVHHRNYDRVYCERPEDLMVLCSDCHRKHHGTEG